MARYLNRLSLYWEQVYPALAGSLATIACVVYVPTIFRIGGANDWQFGALYSSVFDVAAIFTAFLLTFYTFFVTTERGFIAEMKRTVAYRRSIDYVLAALTLGGLLTVLSIPMMVVEPAPKVPSVASVFASFWIGLAVWAAAAFVRAAWTFAQFLRGQASIPVGAFAT